MLEYITGGHLLIGIVGIIIILIVAFLSLLFVSKKKKPNQNPLEQVFSNISEAKQMSNMNTAQPVVNVAPNPAVTSPSTPKAYDPTTGATMTYPTIQPQIDTTVQEIETKVEELDKKIENLNNKMNISTT